MNTPHIDIPLGVIRSFCKRWQITEFALFGSVLRDDFGPDSDVDVLVEFDEEARHTLFDMVDTWRKSCRRYSDDKSIF